MVQLDGSWYAHVYVPYCTQYSICLSEYVEQVNLSTLSVKVHVFPPLLAVVAFSLPPHPAAAATLVPRRYGSSVADHCSRQNGTLKGM